MHRCDTENVVVSSIDSRWAALSFRAKWFPPETDPRYQKCRRDGATVDGVWLAKRTASGWVGKAWVYGDLEPSSLCHILSTAGMPRRVFTELDEFERTC